MGGLLLVGFSLGLSNFAAAIGIGLSGVDARTRLRTGIVFGFFEALMPILGLLLGQTLAAPLAHAGHYIGAGLLSCIGMYVLWTGLTADSQEHPTAEQLDRTRLVITGFALSLDNLVVGFALGLFRVPIILAAAVIACVSVGMSLVGLELGQRLGKRLEKWSEELSGVVLILVGLALGIGVLS